MTVALAGMTLHTNNDNETNWAGTDGPDTYNVAVQGTNSESWLVSKNATETGTLTLAAALNATRGLFIGWMKSDLSYYYTDIRVDLESSASNFKQFIVAAAATPNISGDFKPFILDYVNKGAATGTFVPGSLATIRVIVDNSASGNIRSVINNWVDVMYFGPGHTISGTTVGDKLFTEAAAIDELVANKYGILINFNDIIYAQGDIDLSGTALNSTGETLVFVDTPNGYDTYNFDITGTVTFLNTNIAASGAIDYNFDATIATAFSMTGGSITGALLIDLIDGQTLDSVVIRSTTSTIANDPDSCIWNASGLITVATAGSLNSCVLNKGIDTVAVDIANLDRLIKNNFISDGTGHAVDLGTVSSNIAMAWDNETSGYAGTDGSTGNETILVSVDSGITLTINVASTGTLPTIKNDGLGTVTVVTGQITVAVTVLDDITGLPLADARVQLYDTADYTTEIMNDDCDVNGIASVDRSYTADIDVEGWVREMNISGIDYVPKDISGTITSAGFALTVRLVPLT